MGCVKAQNVKAAIEVVSGRGLKVQGAGFRVQGSGSKVEG